MPRGEGRPLGDAQFDGLDGLARRDRQAGEPLPSGARITALEQQADGGLLHAVSSNGLAGRRQREACAQQQDDEVSCRSVTPSNYGMLVTPLCLASAPAVLEPQSTGRGDSNQHKETDPAARIRYKMCTCCVVRGETEAGRRGRPQHGWRG